MSEIKDFKDLIIWQKGMEKLLPLASCLLPFSMWATAAVAQTPLPCLNSSPQCIEALTQHAIANSPELKTLETQTNLLDQRLKVASESIDYANAKLWTNYLPSGTSLNPISLINPFAWIKNLAGGGDMQRDRLEIANIQLRKADLEATQSEMARRTAEIKTQLSQEILTLVLDYEQKEREIALQESEINHHQLMQKTIEIDYRFGGSSTPAYLQTLQRSQEINANLLQTQANQRQTLSKLLLLTHTRSTTQNAHTRGNQ
jgi:hypothetical protein